MLQQTDKRKQITAYTFKDKQKQRFETNSAVMQ